MKYFQNRNSGQQVSGVVQKNRAPLHDRFYCQLEEAENERICIARVDDELQLCSSKRIHIEVICIALESPILNDPRERLLSVNVNRFSEQEAVGNLSKKHN